MATKCNNGCDATWTGIKMEHCTSCHQTFNNTRAGDKHRAVGFTYTIVKINGKFEQILTGDPIPEGAKVICENCEYRYCLTPEEMRAKGMNQEKNKSWNMGGKAYIPK